MRRKGYEVWISCEGEALQEFRIKLENGGRRVACFVPSEPDKCFSIHCSDLVQQSFFSMEVTLDGRPGGRTLCAPGLTSKRDGLKTSETTLQPYRFAEVATTDVDVSLADTTHLGTIEVALMRRYPGSRDIPFQAWTLPDVGAISERTKTMGAQQVSLGEEVSLDQPGVMQEALPLYPAEGCFVTFVFRYRPLAILQAQGIAPLSDWTDSADEDTGCVIDFEPPAVDEAAQLRLPTPVPSPEGASTPGDASVPDQGAGDGSSSHMLPGNAKRRAAALADETDAEEQQVELQLRPTKRARPVNESELDTLKEGVASLKAQLKRMESHINAIEKNRRSSRSRWTTARRGSAGPREKTEEWGPLSDNVKREMITEGVIDLTLSD